MKIKTKLISIFASIGLFVGLVAPLASCAGKTTMVDYAHNGSVKLLLDYKNHDFFKDGIGEVTVNTYIDGDTTHFRNIYGDTTTNLKSRYYGIDTPESTGAIQPYGKQASNFTHEKLANAAENGTIVVSSPFSTASDGGAGRYGVPETDSTGGRYLSLVWINETVKHAPVESLVLLNLWIVQEGLSWAKNTSEVPAYSPIFSDAQQQASDLKLKMWSDEPDPDFNYGSYEYVSLLDIKRETETYFEDTSYVNKFSGMNVRFNGVVSGYCNHNLYVQQYFPVDDADPSKGGEWAGINIFVGMSAISPAYTTVGTYLEVVGVASNSDTFGFQISGNQGKWPASLNGDDNDCKVILSAEENDGEYALQTFEYDTVNDLNAKIKAKNYENLFCRTKIKQQLVVERAYVNNDGDEVTLYFKDCDFTAYIPFTYHGNPDDAGDVWMTADKFVGKTFEVSGVFAYHLTSSGRITFQIVCCGDTDLVCKTPKAGTVIAEPYSVAEAELNAASALSGVTYDVNGKVGSVNPTETKGTEPTAPVVSIAQALETISALPDAGQSDTEYALTGTITKIDQAWNEEYSNMSFTLADNTGTISIYRAGVGTGLKGSDILLGGEVTVQGKLKKYVKDAVTTPELVDGTILKFAAKSTVSFTMVEDEYSINVVNAEVPASVYGNKTGAEKDALIAEYLAKVVSGSTVIVKGIPAVVNGVVTYSSATLQAVYLHGQVITDPLNVNEAIDIATHLDSGKYTDAPYYITGEVSEITAEYNAETKRLSFKIKAGDVTFLVSDSRMGIGEDGTQLDYNDVVVGKTVVVTARLMNDETLGATTYRNGCQVVIIK